MGIYSIIQKSCLVSLKLIRTSFAMILYFTATSVMVSLEIKPPVNFKGKSEFYFYGSILKIVLKPFILYLISSVAPVEKLWLWPGFRIRYPFSTIYKAIVVVGWVLRIVLSSCRIQPMSYYVIFSNFRLGGSYLYKAKFFVKFFIFCVWPGVKGLKGRNPD